MSTGASIGESVTWQQVKDATIEVNESLKGEGSKNLRKGPQKLVKAAEAMRVLADNWGNLHSMTLGGEVKGVVLGMNDGLEGIQALLNNKPWKAFSQEKVAGVLKLTSRPELKGARANVESLKEKVEHTAIEKLKGQLQKTEQEWNQKVKEKDLDRSQRSLNKGLVLLGGLSGTVLASIGAGILSMPLMIIGFGLFVGISLFLPLVAMIIYWIAAPSRDYSIKPDRYAGKLREICDSDEHLVRKVLYAETVSVRGVQSFEKNNQFLDDLIDLYQKMEVGKFSDEVLRERRDVLRGWIGEICENPDRVQLNDELSNLQGQIYSFQSGSSKMWRELNQGNATFFVERTERLLKLAATPA